MIHIFKKLYQILSPNQRRTFFWLQILVVLMALVDVVAISSIGPFIALSVDIHVLDSNYITNKLSIMIGDLDSHQILFLLGLAVLILLALSAAISVFTTYKLSRFSYSVGSNLSSRLYQYYLKKDWLFYVNASTSQLTKQTIVDSARVTQGLINPLMQINARLVLVIAIIALLFIYQPLFSLFIIVFFPSLYVAIYYLVRRKIVDYECRTAEANTNRFSLLRDGLGGIKELLLVGRQQSLIEKFKIQNSILAETQAKTQVLGIIPRFFMEFVAFGGMIILLLFLMKYHDSMLVDILPLLSIYALAGFKLLPSLQLIYTSLTQIKGSLPSFNAIYDDIISSFKSELPSSMVVKEQDCEISKVPDIKLQNVFFTYPDKSKPALFDICMHIKPNTIVGLVGASGAGKSTTLDIILGLLEPQSGQLIIDDRVLDKEKISNWQQRIGYVPQSIFLTSASIAQNIAFGIAEENIDFDRVRKAVRLAHLEDFIATLPEGLNTTIGENGVQISGGQRQRLGIARALYNQPGVLVFDEATSSLDTITEGAIMDAISDLSGGNPPRN